MSFTSVRYGVVIDFVDGDGDLQKLSSYDKNARATAVLKEKHVYTLVKVEEHSEEIVVKPLLQDFEIHNPEIMAKLRSNFKPRTSEDRGILVKKDSIRKATSNVERSSHEKSKKTYTRRKISHVV
ncbi:uncharacterized protein LOC130623907 isoform X2 [Hydractinia symbiolongicarpus]|uniref:uncharacterized protein LOC130623907 isoform X2 n=1 Tax=Hydractinia symbiolongicarpus TaxID=13093 RepID=UPI002551C789|nr:uncharacterized protein LOC130623907 isoform X2 [Hydractinia symbiolongicarpus]